MALMKCNNCGGKVSSALERCPHCGAPIDATTAQIYYNQTYSSLLGNNKKVKALNMYSLISLIFGCIRFMGDISLLIADMQIPYDSLLPNSSLLL